MEWYYAEGTIKIGPLSDQEFQKFVHSGLIKSDTLVWHPKMSDWEPLSDINGLAQVSNANEIDISALATREICSECRQHYIDNEIIPYRGEKVCPTCRPKFINKITEGFTLTGLVDFSGFRPRALAKLLDFLILSMIYGFIAFPVWMLAAPLLSDMPPITNIIGIVMGLLTIFVLYNSLFIYKFSATPGKMLLRLKIIDRDGDSPNLKKSVVRTFVEIISISFLGAGYIAACFDPKKRTLHDHVGQTLVIVLSALSCKK